MTHEPVDFWLVWCKGGRNPRFSHTSEESARTEAERLAEKHSGRKFFIVHATDRLFVQGEAK